ncbi:hypothetical protein [Curtobacterium sp. Curtsp57]|uniref:COG4705 family protein n=1 Tax=Curtobacterium sp. Curtsp57 TaxID=3243047 RepID=UPI0039B4ABA2
MPRSIPAPTGAAPTSAADARNKVPDPTTSFWVVKVLATTVGETAADLVSTTLGFGLPVTTVVMAVILALFLVLQFRGRTYRPSVYWVSVVLISIVGTCITDNLTDGLGVPLVVSTLVFAAALAVVFTVWFAVEGTLSIHRIDTFRREVFYWLAILFTFALGTAAGDLIGEQTGLGYFPALLLFAVGIALVSVLFFVFRFNGVLCFWAAYVLTRPLGASLGDLLSQPVADGGLGLGTIVISALFLAAIVVIVATVAVRLRRRRGGALSGRLVA